MSFQNPKLDMQKRISFLQCWDNRYPCTSGAGICGMLVFSNDEIWLERNGVKLEGLLGLSSAVFGEKGLHGFETLQVLQSGDWVELFGTSGNGKLNVTQIRLLSPNLDSQGHRSQVNQVIRQWDQFWIDVRGFFQKAGFDELRTPTLVPCPGTEPFLEPFKTELIVGSHKEVLFLPTSPELHLKKCLAKGWDRIFEMRPCFRNGEVSELHQPEFYMLEWYRAFSSMDEIKSDVRQLVEALAPMFLRRQWSQYSVSDLFERYLNFELKPSTTAAELKSLAERVHVDVSRASDFDEIFFFLFLEKIEPHLKNYDCLFLHSYPPSQAALARLTPTGWGDRFEFYIKGLEIANAFNELNDPKIQRQRSQEDLEKKQLYGKLPISMDEDFFRHLEGGMPPSCGIALGLDRLFMALNDIADIRDLRLFPK